MHALIVTLHFKCDFTLLLFACAVSESTCTWIDATRSNTGLALPYPFLYFLTFKNYAHRTICHIPPQIFRAGGASN